MAAPTLHLRSECKPLEHRSALTPTTTKALLEAGFKVNVERSPERIFEDDEFAAVGATLVPEGSWPSAPKDHIIIGLKELPEETFPLHHTHVQFAHCYKGQPNWATVLSRFPAGGGTLLDLEFLTDDSGRRVAAFGYHAGYAGAALALMDWAWVLDHPDGTPMPGVSSYADQGLLVQEARASVARGLEKNTEAPRVIVIGALGRCGKGAVDLCRAAGIPESSILKWDMAETAAGGPFPEVVESDIFVNCIYLNHAIPPFITHETLAGANRKLSVLCDVSADTGNLNSPIPVYDVATTFNKPTLSVPVKAGPPLSVIAIDHLPSLLPREASEAFSSALLPSLLQLGQRTDARVWQQAEKLFREKVATLPNEHGSEKAYTNGHTIPSVSS
ncbi:saccharopine dehydrogenase [Lasallia pustulata]|uniref:Saccharopine dehydrogenase [NAD(+), L-lysine-forming] n=1 Tax=Lasallia pustulata TaxID=136370 RepID=A0A1W5D4D3_9LECA|nr:saccharopine dehydrogenase [Lasallia pustulata]